jgi:1,4-alpha-glucan branching enzyme
MLFMGQEILETRPWSDDVRNWPQFLIDWPALQTDRHKADFHRFVRDLLRLRRERAALRGEGMRVPQLHVDDRILVLHRWVEGRGQDVVVVVSLGERTLYDHAIEMPSPGTWRELFNSDVYDHFPNPVAAGNGGRVQADGPPGATYPHTARITIPANGGLILARVG